MGKHKKVESNTYSSGGYTSNRGFYYDSQLEDPFLSISLHPNTYKDGNEWKVYELKDSLTPTTTDDENNKYDRYSKTPIARCIMTEDFVYSINNNWTDYNGGNAIEAMFDNLKPWAPILAKGAKGLAEGLKSMGGTNNFGSAFVAASTGVGEKLIDLLRKGSDYLNRALMVQGTRFSYYSGSSVNFNNMELKFIVFSDWVNGKFQSVEDYIKNLHQYVFGEYNAVMTNTGIDVIDKNIGNYIGFQSPPGGFTMDTQQIEKNGLNVILKGTMRLNIGGKYAISNLLIKNMTVNLSKTQAKNPTLEGGTVPLYAEITLQLGPACMVVNQGFEKIITHAGVQKDIIDPMKKVYEKELQKKYLVMGDDWERDYKILKQQRSPKK